jgi:hypothetical protein
VKLLFHVLVLLGAFWSAASCAESGRVALTRLTLGEIGGWIQLPIEANGKTGRWLLDTGSTRNLVSAEFAKTHGLARRGSVKADTATGHLQGPEVSLPTLRIGSLDRPRQTALVVDLRLIVGAVAEGLDGILGVPFFDGFELYLDLRDWALDVRKGGIASCPTGMSALALSQYRGLPVIDVVVDEGRAESMLLDTGNPAGLVRVEASAPSASEPGIAVPGPAKLTVAPRIRVGEQLRLNVPVMRLHAPPLKRALGPRIGGLAGTALLDGSRLSVDLSRRRACIENGAFTVPGGFGLTLARRDDGLFVELVLPGGPAQAAGLRQGDVIKSWVGGPTTAPLQELWSRVQGLDEIELAVGDDARPVRLRRAYFAPHLL